MFINVDAISSEEKEKIVKSIHGDEAFGDHLGSKKTFQKLSERFFWKNMKRCQRICEGCTVCRQQGSEKKIEVISYHSVEAVEYCWN